MSIRVKDLLIDGKIPLTENNFNNWVPSLTGEGASGVWTIDISGTANRAITASGVDTYGISGETSLNEGSKMYFGLLINCSGQSVSIGQSNYMYISGQGNAAPRLIGATACPYLRPYNMNLTENHYILFGEKPATSATAYGVTSEKPAYYSSQLKISRVTPNGIDFYTGLFAPDLIIGTNSYSNLLSKKTINIAGNNVPIWGGGLSADALRTSLERRCTVGFKTSSIPETARWFKVASLDLSAWTESEITFKVSAGFGEQVTESGILRAHLKCRQLTATPFYDADLYWEYANKGINPANFRLYYGRDNIKNPTKIIGEIWIKIDTSNTCYHFDRLQEHGKWEERFYWTLDNQLHTNNDFIASNEPEIGNSFYEGYTESSLLALKNNAASLTGLTTTITELNYVDGVTGNIQTQLNNLNTEIQDRYSSKVTRAKNTVLAAPNGSDGTASFRTLVAADIPNLNASKITNGILPISRGGTGLTANPSILVNLASTTKVDVLQASPRPGVTGILPITNGGTGANTAANARTNLKVPSTTGSGASGTWAISITGHASSAEILMDTSATTPVGRSAGSTTTPVYFSSGKPVACNYNLGEVIQLNSAATDFRPLIMGTAHGAAGSLNTEATGQVYVNNNLYACPNTGKLYATNFSTANGSSGGLWIKDSDSTEFGAIYFNGSNLWIGASQANSRHHSGNVYISAGVNTNRNAANETIFITVPVANGTGSSGSYPVLHSNNVSVTWSGDQHINFGLGGSGITNSKTISLTIPYATTNDAGLMSAADKTKLDGLSNGSTSPSSAGMIREFEAKDLNTTSYTTTGNEAKIYAITLKSGTNVQTLLLDYKAIQRQQQDTGSYICRIPDATATTLQATIGNSKVTFQTWVGSGGAECYIIHICGYY